MRVCNVHMAHFQLGSFLKGLVSNWAQFGAGGESGMTVASQRDCRRSALARGCHRAWDRAPRLKLGGTTCLMQASFVLRVFRRLKDCHNLPKYSPLLKKYALGK